MGRGNGFLGKRFVLPAFFPAIDIGPIKLPALARLVQTLEKPLAMLILRQVEAGANIIDVCVDEISVYPDERHECMRWIIPVVQKMTDEIIAIDSSDPQTLAAGLESP